MRYIILVLFIPMMLFGQYRDMPDVVTKVATSAGGFLKLETSARAIGMGGSFVASGRGVSGIPYNPSSIAYIEKNEAYFFCKSPSSTPYAPDMTITGTFSLRSSIRRFIRS